MVVPSFNIIFLYIAVDKFKKQFAYLEEHYGKGGTAPPERQHSSSLPRYPVQIPPSIQGEAARPGKVVGSVLRYPTDTIEQQKVVKNPMLTPAQYIVPNSSYSRKHRSYKTERGEVAAAATAQGGTGSQWY
ncbi:hypothetical protein RD792_017174 [Penstemon davidsonii]|uniref:Uncharacterized protein n=1 Tax=Penstemon davidsonii TaxID=160366 RepID=A0ABR0CLG6_9LAMI|nr:hypothetical protein RD792_017174 [Penstemon davidsonii]